MSYYRIVTPDEGMNIMMKRASHREFFHTNGTSIDATTLQMPLKIEMYAGKEYGYDQFDPDFDGDEVELTLDERLADFYSESALMSEKLTKSLLALGLDNLQVLPTEIIDAETNELLSLPYNLVNVVGVVSCADLDASDASPFGDGFYFHKLIINESKTNGMQIFRLAESHLELIVSESIANVINSGEFSGIAAIPCS